MTVLGWICLVMRWWTSASLVWSGTWKSSTFCDPHSTTTNTLRPSETLHLLYFLLAPNFDSSISTVFPKPPSFIPAFTTFLEQISLNFLIARITVGCERLERHAILLPEICTAERNIRCSQVHNLTLGPLKKEPHSSFSLHRPLRLNKTALTQSRERYRNMMDSLSSNLHSVIRERVKSGQDIMIVFDNFDFRILANVILHNHRSSDMHWIAQYATFERVASGHLDDSTPVVPNIDTFDDINYLLGKTELDQQRQDYTIIVTCILLHFFLALQPLSDVIPSHIQHRYFFLMFPSQCAEVLFLEFAGYCHDYLFSWNGCLGFWHNLLQLPVALNCLLQLRRLGLFPNSDLFHSSILKLIRFNEGLSITVKINVWAALFFTKLKPKIEGAPYPLIPLCLEFSKTWFLFIKLLNVPRNKHKRNWERVAVVHWLFHWVVAPKGVLARSMANRLVILTNFIENLLAVLSLSCSASFLPIAGFQMWPSTGKPTKRWWHGALSVTCTTAYAHFW